jgi:hypothetical protein
LLAFARSPGRRAALLFAGALAGACVFPEYDVKDAEGAGGGGAPQAGAGNSSGTAGAGSSAGLGGAASGSAGEAGLSGSASSEGGSAGNSTTAEGGAGGDGGTSSIGGAGGDGMTGSGGCSEQTCPPSTCDNDVKDPTEAHVDCGDAAGECASCVFPITKSVIGGGGGFSGSAIVTWNASGITFDFTVLDNTPRNDSSEPWNDDAVEVFLDLNNGKSNGYQGDDFQIIVPRDESATNSPQGAANTGSMPVERSSNGTGYKVKLTIPWSAIGAGGDPPLGKTIGFDLAIDDDSDGGGRDSQLVVFGTPENYQNTSNFGQIELQQ